MNNPTTYLQQSPYLREQRKFPEKDIKDLANQVDHAYIDIANKVNTRTIGIYANNFLVITGDKWYFTGSNSELQSLRQIFTFTVVGSIPHNLNWSAVQEISSNCYGSFTDGTNWYGVIYGSNVAIAGEVSFYVTPTDIVILSGAGAPVITSGTIVLEYISKF